VENFSQYLLVKDDPEAVAQKLNSGQTLRGIGVFGRVGYAPEETNPITRDASIALSASVARNERGADVFLARVNLTW
jgi:porin